MTAGRQTGELRIGEPVQYCGRVVKRPFGVGSKSERPAVVLSTSSGDFVLRRPGGNAFHDPQLDQLIGRNICCEGALHGYTLLMTKWSDEGAPPADQQ